MKCSQRWDSNCPRSEVREDGTPKHEIQLDRNSWVTVSVQVFVSEMTSGQWVKRFTQVSRWV